MTAGSKTLAALAAAALAGCATLVFDLGKVSRGLQLGMTEAQVVALAGAQPSSISVQTCGSNTKAPWTCKNYKYVSGWDDSVLTVLFEQDSQGAWLVNSWIAP